MAVYTEVSFDEAAAFLQTLELGTLQAIKGCAGGIENTNYFVDTDQGHYVLTLFERLTFEQLPYYLHLMKHLAARGIPVMAHVGLTPQAVNILGGYGVRGKSEEEARAIVEDALAMSDAGAFAMVIEGVLEPIAIEITQRVKCPTIGIGAGAGLRGAPCVLGPVFGARRQAVHRLHNGLRHLLVGLA